MSLTGRPPVQKGTIARNKKHLAYVRSYGCLVCQRPAQAHHLRHDCEPLGFTKMMGKKQCDYRTVPLCPEHHHELHEVFGNELRFWRHYWRCSADAIARLLAEAKA